MNQKQFFEILKLFALIFLLTSCFGELRSQNPRDTFVSEKFPQQLERIRSQMREITQTMRDEILKRVENDKTRTDLIRVAVIDSGTDIAHKDLYRQIDYKVENGRIVGAGVDIMGKSPFASHVFVNPTMYAFTPYPLKNGRIDKHPENPLKDLKDINDRFTDLILKGIQADPDLKSGFYNRLNSSNFNILGFSHFYEKTRDSLLEHTKDADFQPIDPKNPQTKEHKEKVKEFKESNWEMDSLFHSPDELSRLESFKHYDKFVDLVLASLTTVNSEFSYFKRIRNLNLFINPKLESYETLDLMKDPNENLQKSMRFVQFGYDAFDPILSLENFFKSHPEYKKMSFAQALRLHMQKIKDTFARIMNETTVDSEERQNFKKAHEEFKKFENIIANILAIRENPEQYQRFRSQLRRNVIRNHHPYISSESANNEHGTHVAGIIALQDERIRIVPIRVNTQGLTEGSAKFSQNDSIESLKKRFEQFKKTPYFNALLSEIAAEHKTKISTSRVTREVNKYLKENAFNAHFIEEVFSSIRAAGQNQLLLANVSLGVTFNKDHTLDNKPAAIAIDLLAELFRHDMGLEIEKFAPKTLFVVATGNEGDWFDGLSRTNFPVSITSIRLMKITEALNLPHAPNNRMKNVLAVGSVNQRGHLTQFSNLPIIAQTPVVFSTGEEIMSPVPGKSETKAFEVVENEFKILHPLFEEINNFNDNQQDLETDSKKSLQLLRSGVHDKKLVSLVEDALEKLIVLRGKVDRVRMSGTSMATPTVTGIIAKLILKKMKSLRVSLAKVYNDPRFSPEALIDDVMKLATDKKLGILSMEILTEKIKTWDPAKDEALVKNYPKQLAAPNCRYLFSK